MNEEMKIVREINIEAERFYPDAQKLGDHAVDALGGDRRSQMTALENIAENAQKTSDIFDYIKKQIARSKDGKDWRKAACSGQDNTGFGECLKTYFEEDFAKRLDVVYSHLGIEKVDTKQSKAKTKESKEQKETDKAKQLADVWRRQDIHLRLMRQFIRQMVIQYEYKSGSFGIEEAE